MPLGKTASRGADVAADVASEISLWAVISKVLRMKAATVLIAALAASFIDAVPAVAGPTGSPMFWSPRSHSRQPDGLSSVRATQRVCRHHDSTARRSLSPEAWKDLMRVNKWVNETIKPLTDLEHWGVVERWSYPDDGYGDCEDYVLLKRRMLIQSGWPREALLVTMVRDKKDEGHAVLTVTTDEGDYVLDNQKDDILLWSKTGYRFIKRQSQSNPNVWVSLGDRRPAIVTSSSR